MEKDFFDFIIKKYSKNSVKKACFIIREYIRCKKYNDLENCAVTEKEFSEALTIVLAHSYNTSDANTEAKTWHCDGDCNRNNGMYAFCPGEFQLDKNSDTLCEYYSDSFCK